jgi:lipopolysaccharide biosynthesis regulator YciM
MNEKDIDIIESYLAGKLPAEDRKEVEDRLLTDREFAQRVEIFMTLPHLVSESSHDFRNELEGLYQEYHQQNKTSDTVSRRTFLMAASFALLISIIGILIWLLPVSLTPQEMYTAHFTVPADNITVRNEQDIPPALQSAMEAYNEQAYPEAVTQFETILENDPANVPVLFYSGVSYLILKETEKAVQNLQKVMQTDDTTYKLTATWYLGLAHLEQGNIAQAREVFFSLKESGSSYARRADAILQQLEAL